MYEEVARIYGYEKIDESPLLSESKNVPFTEYVCLNRKIEDILVRNLHCSQTETYPWVSEKTLDEFGVDKKSLYELQNPVNPEMPFMRDGLLYELVSHTARNSKFFDECKIFDIGKVRKKADDRSQITENKKFASGFVDEQWQLGVMLYQKDVKNRDKDPILLAKNMVKTILRELGVS